MPKLTKRKVTQNDAPKRNSKKNKSLVEEDQPIVTTVDKIEEITIKKGVKRKASSTVENNIKKNLSTSEINPLPTTQELEDEEIPIIKPMILKTSNRLTSKGEKANMKISSWNINGIRAWSTNGGSKYIDEEQPDIICFQELKCDKDKIPSNVTPSGYKSYWLSGDTAGYSGVGLLTKIDPINVKYGIGIAEHDVDGRVITAEYTKFYLVVSYIPNSGRNLVRLEYRKQFNEAFRKYLQELDKTKPVIWCGDLNVSHQSIDLANPSKNGKIAGYTKEEREDFSKILADGFVDAFRSLYPDQRDAYTFWSYFRNARNKNIGWRLDYFIISTRLQEYLCDVIHQTDVYGSDHCPIVMLLAI